MTKEQVEFNVLLHKQGINAEYDKESGSLVVLPINKNVRLLPKIKRLPANLIFKNRGTLILNNIGLEDIPKTVSFENKGWIDLSLNSLTKFNSCNFRNYSGGHIDLSHNKIGGVIVINLYGLVNLNLHNNSITGIDSKSVMMFSGKLNLSYNRLKLSNIPVFPKFVKANVSSQF